MAVPRLDPRFNADRIYSYNDYIALSEQYRGRKTRSWYEFIPIFANKRDRRSLGYRVASSAGLLVLSMALSIWAFMAADNARLSYAAQEHKASIAGMEQSIQEAVSQNKAAEAELFANGKTQAAAVVYPVQMKFITLTNIPEAEGKTLVDQLYPLSSEVIKVAP